MEWNYRKWRPAYRFIFLAIIVIVSSIIFANRLRAEETIGDHVKEAVFDTLSAGAITIAAAEAAASGNPVAGAILCSLASREVFNAYGEAKAAWELFDGKGFINEVGHQICESFDPWYKRNDDPNRNDRDISPAESMMEHGRD